MSKRRCFTKEWRTAIVFGAVAVLVLFPRLSFCSDCAPCASDPLKALINPPLRGLPGGSWASVVVGKDGTVSWALTEVGGQPTQFPRNLTHTYLVSQAAGVEPVEIIVNKNVPDNFKGGACGFRVDAGQGDVNTLRVEGNNSWQSKMINNGQMPEECQQLARQQVANKTGCVVSSQGRCTLPILNNPTPLEGAPPPPQTASNPNPAPAGSAVNPGVGATVAGVGTGLVGGALVQCGAEKAAKACGASDGLAAGIGFTSGYIAGTEIGLATTTLMSGGKLSMTSSAAGVVLAPLAAHTFMMTRIAQACNDCSYAIAEQAARPSVSLEDARNLDRIAGENLEFTERVCSNFGYGALEYGAEHYAQQLMNWWYDVP